MVENDESYFEDTVEKEESIDEEMDNDEISPEEEGFMQGYNSVDEPEEKKPSEEEE